MILRLKYKRILLLIFYQLLFLSIYSQEIKKNRIGLVLEYNASSPNSIISTHSEDYYVDEKAVTNYRAGYGAGIGYGIKIERKIHPNVFLYLTPSYQNGFSCHIGYQKTDTTEFNSFLKTQQYLLNPGVKFEIPVKKLTFSMQCGLIFPLKVISQLKNENLISNNLSKQVWNSSYNFNAGFQAGIGFDISFNEHLKLGFLLQGKMLSLTLKEAILNSYQVNNNDNLQNLKKYDTNIIYLEDLNKFSNNMNLNPKYEENKARNELTQSHSFSTIGMQISFVYQF